MLIRIADLHHEVLLPWAELRRSSGTAPAVLTLDFHTDTLSAMRRGVPAPEAVAWQAPAAVAEAVRLLHHDEHFDWALRAGVISRAVILAMSPQNGACAHPGMEVRAFAGQPELSRLLNDPENVRDFAGKILSSGLPEEIAEEFAAMRGPWVLDVDCDVFLTSAAPDFPEHGAFARLVRQAALVTVSREPDWVRLLRFPGENITGDTLARVFAEKCRHIGG